MKHLPISLLLLFFLQIPAIATGKDTGRETMLEEVMKKELARQFLPALTSLESVVTNFPDDKSIQLIHGRLLIKNGFAEQAIERLQPLVKETSNDWRPWFWLGTAYLIVGDLDVAGTYLEEALAREGQIASIWVQRAIVEQEKGNPSSSVNLLQAANAIEPDNLDIVLNLAYASERSGNIKQAIKAYKHFLNLSASSPHHGRARSQVSLRLTLF